MNHGIDLTKPGGIQALLDFHRLTFGSATMEDDVAVAAAAAAAKVTSDAAAAKVIADAAALEEELGFPANTAWKEMKPEQQVAYWRHQSRRHEARSQRPDDYDQIVRERDELLSKTQTAAEKEIATARKEARVDADKDARAALLPQLVHAKFEVFAAGRIPAERLAEILEPLDTTKFLTSDGQVDTDKVKKYVEGIAPAKTSWPDMGQGRRQQEKSTGVGAGRSLYAQSHPTKS